MIRWRVEQSRVRIPARRFFCSAQWSERFRCPPSLLVNGYWEPLSGVKRPGNKADYLPPSSPEINNEWSYTSTPTTCLRGKDTTFTFTSCRYQTTTPRSSSRKSIRVRRTIYWSCKRDEVSGEWTKLHNEELNDLHCSPNISREFRSRMRQVGHDFGGETWRNSFHRVSPPKSWMHLSSPLHVLHAQPVSGVDERIISRWIFRKWDGDAGGQRLDWPSGSIKCGVFFY